MSLLEKPVLRMTATDKKELLDPRSLEGYQPGDTIALIYGPDLIYLIDLLKESLDQNIELAIQLQLARELIEDKALDK